KARASGRDALSICRSAPLKPKDGLNGPPALRSKPAQRGHCISTAIRKTRGPAECRTDERSVCCSALLLGVRFELVTGNVPVPRFSSRHLEVHDSLPRVRTPDNTRELGRVGRP